jgi:hypothetical protein
MRTPGGTFGRRGSWYCWRMRQKVWTLVGIVGGLAIVGRAGASPLGFSATMSGLYGYNLAGDVRDDPYSLGLALEAGVELPGALYAGASLQHFFGRTLNETLLSDPPIRLDRTASVTALLGHVGFDWHLEALVLRPSLGIGYALTSIERTSSSGFGDSTTATTEGSLALSPAAEVRIPFAGLASACIEARYDIALLAGEDQAALGVGIGVGVDL